MAESTARATGDRPIRILLAKPGLDGHDRGAKVVALALRAAGFEVIYTGLHQTVGQIVSAALDEDVDVIGVSILSGAHLTVAERLLGALSVAGLGEVPVLVGGSIPAQDVPALQALGVAGVFPPGSRFDAIADFVRARLAAQAERRAM